MTGPATVSTPPPNPGVWSETAVLTLCALCPPGPEHDYMLPSHLHPLLQSEAGWQPNPDYLLFDDLVLLDQMRDEHAQLMAVVAATTQGRGAVDLRRLLRDVLSRPDVAAQVIEDILALEQQRGPLPLPLADTRGLLLALSGEDLCSALLCGVCPQSGQLLLRTPAPNLLFARDLWVCIGDTIAVGWPAMPARWRDGVLARAVARHHPLLQGRQVLDIREASGAGQSRCLEGGDVLVLGPDLILVGVGERTNWAGAVALHAALQANPPAGQQPPRVVAVLLPDQRAMMHLDTVVTCVAPGLALAYLPVFDPASPVGQRVELFDLSQPDVALGADLAAWLPRWGHPMTLLPCGGGQIGIAEREQWSDGANALCLGPGQIVLYGRNRATLQVLNQNGFEIMGPDRYIANAALYARTGQRLVVALPGSELSRGRGGPRCLTLPLARQSLSLGRFAA